MKILSIISECYPNYRVDVDALFINRIPSTYDQILIMQSTSGRGHTICSAENNSRIIVYSGCAKSSLPFKIIKYLKRFLFSMFYFFSHFKRVDLVIVKDLFFIATVSFFVGRVFNRRCKNFFWLSYPFPEDKRQRAQYTKSKFKKNILLVVSWYEKILYSFIFRFADNVVFQSKAMQLDYMIRYKMLSASRTTYVPMGIEAKDYPCLEVTNVTDNLSMCYIGAISFLRGLKFILNSFSLVREVIPNATLDFIGNIDIEERRYIDSFILDNNLENAIGCISFLPRQELYKALQSYTVCLAPYAPDSIIQTTSPTKFYEYLMMEKVVVATEHPEIIDVVNNVKCAYISPWNEKLFSDKIVSAFLNYSESLVMAKNGRCYAETYCNYDFIFKKFQLWMNNCISR